MIVIISFKYQSQWQCNVIVIEIALSLFNFFIAGLLFSTFHTNAIVVATIGFGLFQLT